MAIEKAKVVNIFQNCKSFGAFKTNMMKLGFRFNNNGCNKYVFINPRINWVTKILHGQPDQFPEPESKIAKYFVWPEFVKTTGGLSESLFELWFQDRVDCRSRLRAHKELMEIFLQEKINWTKDNHDWNVGYYKGKPVIFDF